MTKWRVNDDRRLFKVFSYLNSTKHYQMRSKLNPEDPWQLWLFTDANHASKTEHGYSTSGSLLVVAAGWFLFSNSFSTEASDSSQSFNNRGWGNCFGDCPFWWCDISTRIPSRFVWRTSSNHLPSRQHCHDTGDPQWILCTITPLGQSS